MELTVGPGFLLLAAWLYFLGGGPALTAFATAALAHELGHLTAMWLLGARVTGLRLTAAGPVIEYAGALSQGREALVAAAGPAAGLCFAGACMLADTPYFRYAGLLALLSSAFNLLPILPLDGGRLASYALGAVLPPRGASAVLRAAGPSARWASRASARRSMRLLRPLREFGCRHLRISPNCGKMALWK